uniref:Uncharacterized protein n=1 Tax=Rhizophora mucronata TaxID=61149 RepID=A0A2P2NIC4_RHIMU
MAATGVVESSFGKTRLLIVDNTVTSRETQLLRFLNKIILRPICHKAATAPALVSGAIQVHWHQ